MGRKSGSPVEAADPVDGVALECEALFGVGAGWCPSAKDRRVGLAHDAAVDGGGGPAGRVDDRERRAPPRRSTRLASTSGSTRAWARSSPASSARPTATPTAWSTRSTACAPATTQRLGDRDRRRPCADQVEHQRGHAGRRPVELLRGLERAEQLQRPARIAPTSGRPSSPRPAQARCATASGSTPTATACSACRWAAAPR